jgi:hypothetical protein
MAPFTADARRLRVAAEEITAVKPESSFPFWYKVPNDEGYHTCQSGAFGRGQVNANQKA